MRAIALLTAIAMAAAVATPATAAPKKAKKPAVTDTNEQSWNLVKDSVPLWLPTGAKLIYYGMPQQQDQQPKKGKRKAASAQ